ncbi:GNAT family N-acetyltransferase [Paenibacillus sp. GYB006]|uniref:GNAT family N-acetyltransferase n=1 Tax=Paenibacillus sp. GYB006 TaxID=2994394 RepID=UPI002F969965
MESNIHLRWATAKDALDLVKLNNEFNGVGITEEEVIENLSYSNELVALALMNNVPVGFACAQFYKSICYPNPHAEITEMFIKEDVRRKGIATSLLAFIEAELKLRGVSSVKLLTGKKNEAAIQTYERSSYIKQKEQVLQKKL